MSRTHDHPHSQHRRCFNDVAPKLRKPRVGEGKEGSVPSHMAGVWNPKPFDSPLHLSLTGSSFN